MLISKAKFLSYQNTFYKHILATPYKIKLEIIKVKEAPSDEFSMESFVGDSPRESEFFEFNALYEKEISNRTREKYGLPMEVNGTVYLSPKQLVGKFKDYHLDWNRTKVHFEGRVQVIDKVVYLEEFKVYNSCVGIQIFLKDCRRPNAELCCPSRVHPVTDSNDNIEIEELLCAHYGREGNRRFIRANRGFGIFAIIGIAKKCPKPLFFFSARM